MMAKVVVLVDYTEKKIGLCRETAFKKMASETAV
jgi:hypothetical protein